MAEFDQFTSADQPPQDEDPAAEFLKREQEELAGLDDDGFGLQTEAVAESKAEEPSEPEHTEEKPTEPEHTEEKPTEPEHTEEKPTEAEIKAEEPSAPVGASEASGEVSISTDEVVKEATPSDDTAPKTIGEDASEPEQIKTDESVMASDAGIYENLGDMPVDGDAFTAAPPPEFQTQPPVTDAEFDPFGAEHAGADLVDNDYVDFDYNSVTESDMYSAIKQEDVVREEPEKIKRWREEQNERLQKKDVESEEKKKEWRIVAMKELEDWYKHRQEQLDKTKLSNREGEAEFVRERDENIPGHEWERISRLCDFNPKGSRTTKDVSRMRSILLQLKQTPLVKSS